LRLLNDAISLKIKIREKKRGRQSKGDEQSGRERRERRDGPTDLDEDGLDAIVAVPVGENG
jgi:hypothetical protein